jgi:hypothetical protein
VTVAQWEGAITIAITIAITAAVAWNVLRDLPASAAPGDAP